MILSVAVDNGETDRVRKFVSEIGFRLPVIHDPDGDIRKQYEVAALPMTYILNKDTRIVARTIGARDWDNDDVLAALKQLTGACQ